MVDRVTLLVCGPSVFSDEMWRRLLSEAKSASVSRGVVSRSSIAYYSTAGSSASQRKIAAEFVDAESKLGRHAILSDSSLQRGALKALSWLIPSLKLAAFATDDLTSASQWIAEVDPHDCDATVALLSDALKMLGVGKAA